MATSVRPTERTWAHVTVPHAGWAAVAGSVIVVVALLYMARRFDFFYDEWDFVLTASSWGLRDYFEPHNQHWSTVPQVIYKLLLEINGMRSYMSFMGVLLALHATAALFLFKIVRRRSGDLFALVAMAMLLLLGRGWMDILWAFQIGFVGSVALGLLAIDLLDSEQASAPRLAAGSVSLLFSLMCSGVGILFCIAVGTDLILDPMRRRRLLTLVLPIFGYTTWYLAIGRQPATPSSPLDLMAVVTFIPYGMGAAVAGLFSLSAVWSQLALAALAALAGFVSAAWFRQGRVDSRVIGATAAFGFQYLLTGLVRSQLGDAEAASSRYVYVGAVFLLLAITGIAHQLPWRRAWPALLAVLAISVMLNAEHLRQAAAGRDSVAAVQRAEFATLWLFRDAPGLDPNAVVDGQVMPQVRAGKYIAARQAYGSSLPSITSEQLSTLPAPAVNQTLARVLPIDVAQVPASRSDRPQACASTDATAGFVEVLADGGKALRVRTPAPGQVRVYFWLEGSAAPDTPAWSGQVAGEQELVVRLPDAGTALSWHLRVDVPAGGSGSVCPT